MQQVPTYTRVMDTATCVVSKKDDLSGTDYLFLYTDAGELRRLFHKPQIITKTFEPSYIIASNFPREIFEKIQLLVVEDLLKYQRFDLAVPLMMIDRSSIRTFYSMFYNNMNVNMIKRLSRTMKTIYNICRSQNNMILDLYTENDPLNEMLTAIFHYEDEWTISSNHKVYPCDIFYVPDDCEEEPPCFNNDYYELFKVGPRMCDIVYGSGIQEEGVYRFNNLYKTVVPLVITYNLSLGRKRGVTKIIETKNIDMKSWSRVEAILAAIYGDSSLLLFGTTTDINLGYQFNDLATIFKE